MLDEKKITGLIIEEWSRRFKEALSVDVAIAGGGPAGLCAAYYLSKEGKKVAVFERGLSVGGGMWGGGMMMNICVFQEAAKEILDEFGIKYKECEKGYYLTNAPYTVSMLCSKAVEAGALLFNLFEVEDVMVKDEKVTGLVLNWTAVKIASLHVDPITVEARYCVDATGHGAEVVKVLVRKVGKKLFTKTGDLIGEGPMWAEEGERLIVENTKEVFPNLFVAGMATNAVFGGPRMGPVFGGMLLSGKKVASLISSLL